MSANPSRLAFDRIRQRVKQASAFKSAHVVKRPYQEREVAITVYGVCGKADKNSISQQADRRAGKTEPQSFAKRCSKAKPNVSLALWWTKPWLAIQRVSGFVWSVFCHR